MEKLYAGWKDVNIEGWKVHVNPSPIPNNITDLLTYPKASAYRRNLFDQDPNSKVIYLEDYTPDNPA